MKKTISFICLMLALFALSACGRNNDDVIDISPVPSILPSIDISPDAEESPDADTDIDILPDDSTDNNGTEASPETSPGT